jgi:hypothetical protein
MSTYLQEQTSLQLQTQVQSQHTPPQTQNHSPRLPPQIEAAFKQQLLQAAVGSGKELAPEILDELLRSLCSVAASNPDALKQRLLGLLPPEQAGYWHQQLTQLQTTTLIQTGISPPPTIVESSAMPAPQPDLFLLGETVKFFLQCGVSLDLALQWAKHLTPGFEPDRPLTDEELARIQELLTNQQIEELAESVQATPLKSAAPPPALLATQSPVVGLVQLLMALALLFIVFRMGAIVERQSIRNCIVSTSAIARCLTR